MSRDVRADGTVEGPPTSRLRSTQARQADTSNSPQRPQEKLDHFLKKNLQHLGSDAVKLYEGKRLPINLLWLGSCFQAAKHSAAQTMIGLKYFFFGIIGSWFLSGSNFRNVLFCFYIGYPFWAAGSCVTTGLLTILSAIKHTKLLIELNIGANVLSSVLSSIGIILLSLDLFNALFDCSHSQKCLLEKPFTTCVVLLQMVLICVQTAISFLLSGLTYKMNGTSISWVSVLSRLVRSHSESCPQDVLTRPGIYEDLELRPITAVYYDP